MICEAGAVVLVPFPFVDRPIAKHRPAAVLSTRDFNADNGQSILVMITTAARSTWPSDVALSDLGAAGLTRQSSVRWKVFTIPNQLILRRLGGLGDKDRRAVRSAARRHLSG